MRSLRLFLILLFGVISNLRSLPASVINALPEDGSWVAYHLTQHADRNGQINDNIAGTLKIKSVGREEVDGVSCRWIEFEFAPENPAEVEKEWVVKDLIPESEIGFGKDTLHNILKGWSRNSRKEIQPRDAFPSFVDHREYPGNWESEDCEKPASVFKYQQGELALDPPIAGHSQYKNDRLFIKTHNTLWRHSDVPFGTVKVQQRMEMRTAEDEPVFKSYIRELELIDFGKGAKSALPNSN